MAPKPIYEGPPVKPDWEAKGAIEELKKHLQTAILLELHTIPLYLFAAYSIKDNAFSAHKFLSKSSHPFVYIHAFKLISHLKPSLNKKCFI
jgi:hypothetical protein